MNTHTPRKWSSRLGTGGLALLACIAVALCGLIGSPRAAHAAVGDYGTLEDGTYSVSPILSSSMNWDVVAASTSNGAKIHSYHHHGAAQQCWKITTDSDGYSTIINVNSGKALDVDNGTVADDKQLQQWEPNGSKAQKWKIIEVEGGYKIASAVNESYVIDLYCGSTVDGTAIQLYHDLNNNPQTWTFTKVSNENNTVVTDKGKLFDTSVYVTDAQPGTITWEKIPSGWSNQAATYIAGSTKHVINAAVYTGGSRYTGGSATPVVRVDKCCKVNGKWASIRLTFSNISSTGFNYYSKDGGYGASDGDPSSQTIIGFSSDNIWEGFWFFSIDYADVNIELFYTDSGETISLDGAWMTANSLNANWFDTSALGENAKYLTDKTISSYTVEGTGVEQRADGTWFGGRKLWEYDNWEKIGTEQYLVASVAFKLQDDKPTFRFGTIRELHRGAFNINFAPLTIATPPSPTKSATITG